MSTQDSANQHWARKQGRPRWGFYLLLTLHGLLFLGWSVVMVGSWMTESSQLTTVFNLMMAGIGLFFLLESGYLLLWPQLLRPPPHHRAMQKVFPLFPFVVGAGFFLKGVLQVVFPTSFVPSLLAGACIVGGISLFLALMMKASASE